MGMLPEAHITPPPLPPTPAPPTIVRAGGAIREPRKIVNVQPVFGNREDAGIQDWSSSKPRSTNAAL